jgi:hypothetical protein
MKVAYIFSTQGHTVSYKSTQGHTVSYKLGQMILPQLETDAHGVDVVGMFFFEDNNYVLVKGDPLGERLAKVARDKGMLLMGCDKCCYEREIDGFPNLYEALSGNMPDQVITL